MQQDTLKLAKDAYEAICNLSEGTSGLSKIKSEYGSDWNKMLSYYDSELVRFVEPFKYISSDCIIEDVLHEDSDSYVCDDHVLRNGEMIEVYDDDDDKWYHCIVCYDDFDGKPILLRYDGETRIEFNPPAEGRKIRVAKA